MQLLPQKKIFLFSTLLLCASIFIPHIALAKSGDMKVVFSHNPLFKEIGIVPGDTATETITVTNNSAEEKTIGITFIGTSTHELDNKLFFTILENGVALFGGQANPKTLADLLGQGQISITTIHPSATKVLTINADFSVSAGNLYQKKSSVFDIEVGFVYSPQPVTNAPSLVHIDPIINFTKNTNGKILGEETTTTPTKNGIKILGLTLPLTGTSIISLLTLSLSTIAVACVLLVFSRRRQK